MDKKTLTPEQAEGRRKWIIGFTALKCVTESAVKLILGYATGSAGLVADGFHSMTDVAGTLVVWVGIRLSTNRYKSYPYGFYKIENFLAMAIGFAIVYAAYELVQGFFHSEAVMPAHVSVSIAVLIFLIAANFFWGRFEIQTGRLIHSPGIEASGKHTLTDLYSSVAVLVGLVGVGFGINVDRWVSLVIAIILVKVGFEIIWDNIKVLLDISLPQEQLRRYREVIQEVPGVVCVTSVRGRNSGSYRFVDAGIQIRTFDLTDANKIAADVQQALKSYDDAIETVSVHHSYELPKVIKVFIPTEGEANTISDHFGKSPYITTLLYDRESMTASDIKTEKNSLMDVVKGRGRDLAKYLMEHGVDSVCCRENLRDKGPGLMLHRHGIDTRMTEEKSLSVLLEDYLENSRAVFTKTD
ncbi:cation diffusion facilitator family transporter [Candidatus Magnetobacterium casense]|uniref:Cation diffusion facilitator family transporter n=1 Tax=Candidatus Magnetobacterium casense TaxID=1455061 RepID=A0ABS6S127_9BACT|nr:cation diffusion facilitator family transporter [Candidatus Magnetobacterium casensis]MBV6342108.1 cation diffusion facilitator family transporter [Candidatus Magnetobacterium casensis]